MILCPSLLDKQYYPDRSTHIPVPFEGEWKRRGKITTFVHNSGNGGLRGRNGTKEFVAALTYLDSDCDVIIRTQSDYPTHKDIPLTKATVEIRSGDADHSSLYSEGEAFVFPEKFNGLSLPLQEAYASGMVVLATNRFPNYTWLPSKHLIPTRGFCETRIAPHLQRFSEAIVNPIDIAVKMDEAFGTDAGDYSEMARSRVEDEFSWKVLKSRYMELIRNVSEM
jgi:glycosyltransferase involved in cell wall biosynthesis